MGPRLGPLHTPLRKAIMTAPLFQGRLLLAEDVLDRFDLAPAVLDALPDALHEACVARLPGVPLPCGDYLTHVGAIAYHVGAWLCFDGRVDADFAVYAARHIAATRAAEDATDRAEAVLAPDRAGFARVAARVVDEIWSESARDPMLAAAALTLRLEAS